MIISITQRSTSLFHKPCIFLLFQNIASITRGSTSFTNLAFFYFYIWQKKMKTSFLMSFQLLFTILQSGPIFYFFTNLASHPDGDNLAGLAENDKHNQWINLTLITFNHHTFFNLFCATLSILMGSNLSRSR